MKQVTWAIFGLIVKYFQRMVLKFRIWLAKNNKTSTSAEPFLLTKGWDCPEDPWNY